MQVNLEIGHFVLHRRYYYCYIWPRRRGGDEEGSSWKVGGATWRGGSKGGEGVTGQRRTLAKLGRGRQDTDKSCERGVRRGGAGSALLCRG